MNYPTIIVLNLDDKLDITSFLNYCDSKFVDHEIIIASKTKHKNIIGATEYVFKGKKVTEDKVLNTLIPKTTGNKLVVIRKIDKSSYNQIERFVNGITTTNQICTYRKKRNKFMQILHNIINKGLKLLFGYTLFDGDFNIVSFGPNAVDLLKELNNSSMYTKVNVYKGFDLVELDQEKPCRIKFKTNNLKNYIYMGIMGLCILVPMFCWIFIKGVQKSFWLKSLFVLVMLVSLCILLTEIILITVKRFVGENECDKIDYVEQKK